MHSGVDRRPVSSTLSFTVSSTPSSHVIRANFAETAMRSDLFDNFNGSHCAAIGISELPSTLPTSSERYRYIRGLAYDNTQRKGLVPLLSFILHVWHAKWVQGVVRVSFIARAAADRGRDVITMCYVYL